MSLDKIRHPAPDVPTDDERLDRAEYWLGLSPSKAYVFWAEGTTLFKVGRTRGHVDDRLRNVAAMSPLPLKCLAEGYGGSARETYLHKHLAPYRHHGEWFDLPDEKIFWLLGQFGNTSELRRFVDAYDG